MWAGCLVGVDYGRCRLHKYSRSYFHSISYGHTVADSNLLYRGYGCPAIRAHASAHFDQRSHADIYRYTHTVANCNFPAYRAHARARFYQRSHADIYGYTHTVAVAYLYAVPCTCSDARADGHCLAFSHGDAYQRAVAQPESDPYGRSIAYTYESAFANPDFYCHTRGYADSNQHSHSHSHCNTLPDIYSGLQT